jgi:hypothetical protein
VAMTYFKVLTLIFLDGLRNSMKNVRRIGFQVSNTGSWEMKMKCETLHHGVFSGFLSSAM